MRSSPGRPPGERPCSRQTGCPPAPCGEPPKTRCWGHRSDGCRGYCVLRGHHDCDRRRFRLRKQGCVILVVSGNRIALLYCAWVPAQHSGGAEGHVAKRATSHHMGSHMRCRILGGRAADGPGPAAACLGNRGRGKPRRVGAGHAHSRPLLHPCLRPAFPPAAHSVEAACGSSGLMRQISPVRWRWDAADSPAGVPVAPTHSDTGCGGRGRVRPL